MEDNPAEHPAASVTPEGLASAETGRTERRRVAWAVTVTVLIAAVLICPNLGGPKFWGDEADGALLARNILRFGMPIAYDGRYLVESEKTIYAPGYLWNQHPWAAHYLCAASFALFVVILGITLLQIKTIRADWEYGT